MGHKPDPKVEVSQALSDMIHAENLIKEALKTVEKKDNRQLIQNTLNSVSNALDATRTSTYSFNDNIK
ncbi:MAG: hypothetical protein Q4B63_09105 [Clostridium perfringens]|nr:hypothetical protein [Clostridium perfringens]